MILIEVGAQRDPASVGPGSHANPWVMFVTQYYGRARGGLGRYEESLLPHLRTLCSVETGAIQAWSAPRSMVQGLALVGRDLNAVLRGHPFRLPRSRPGQIVHLTNQLQAAGLLWARRARPSIVTVHDIIPLLRSKPWHEGRPSLVERLLALHWALGLTRADLIIADSLATRRDLVAYLRLPPKRIRVVPLGVDAQQFSPLPANDDAVLASLRVPTDVPYVLYVGSGHPRKNLPVLFRALPIVRRTVPACALVLAGVPSAPDGPVAAPPREASGTLTDPQLHILGHVTQEQLAALYRRASACVVPSYYEGFGLTALEAMACACPTVVAESSSLPEVVGPSGLLFQPHDHEQLANHILRLVTDREFAGEIAARGHDRSKLFTWKRTARQTAALYSSLANVHHR